MPDADLDTLYAPHSLPQCIQSLRAAELSAGFVGGGAQWAPDRPIPPTVWELFSSSDDASGEGLALEFAAFHRDTDGASPDWLWVQDAASIRRGGRPFLHGLPASHRSGLVHVAARNPADALWAMEEGVRCGALSFVIGEIAGDPRALDFTATRRLVLAAERHGVPLYLLRHDGAANLSAARLRWRVEAAPSADHRWNAVAPARARAQAELFRGRGLKPGILTLEHGGDARDNDECSSDGPGHRLHLVAEPCDRPLEPQRRAAG